MISRDDAVLLLKEHVKQENLIQHSLAVEAGMRAYANHFSENEDEWGIAGILHDLDYGEFPEEHPSFRIREWLSGLDVSEHIIKAIELHGEPKGVRKELIEKTLHAVDSISGIIVATALVRPNGFDGMKPKSVVKKIKDKSFAAKMDRERMYIGCEELGIEMSEHLSIMTPALQEISDSLIK